MSNYALHSSQKTHTAHSVLIGAPLVIVLAFAFGFVLMQPVTSANTRLTSASKTASSKTPTAKTSAPSNFVPVPLPQTNLPTLSPVPASGEGSLDAATDATITTSPQAASPSSGATHPNSLQAAIPNHSNASKPLDTKSSSSNSILTNLLGL